MVIKVHLKGTFARLRPWAAADWRELVKGEAVDDPHHRDHVGVGHLRQTPQTNYGAAKAGIAAFTEIAGGFGAHPRDGITGQLRVLVRTWLTEPAAAGRSTTSSGSGRYCWIAPIVTWLASTERPGVTGRVFQASGTRALAIAEGWDRAGGAGGG